MARKDARDVDWPFVEGALAIRPTVKVSKGGRVEALLFCSQRLPRSATLLEFGFALVGGLRQVLGLDRVALYLRSKSGLWLSGLVGTSLDGQLVDERSLRHRLDPLDEELWRDLAEGRRSFEMLENAPLVSHHGEKTSVVGRGWFVKTPIACGDEPLGFLYNDSFASKAPFDREAQELTAVFLMLAAERLRAVRDRAVPLHHAGRSKKVVECLEVLAADPTLSNRGLASRLDMTPNRLSRMFAEEMGTSLLDYRNELRLQRFFALEEAAERDHQQTSLVKLSMEAGFGSYSQFHRVFCARYGRSPRRYVSP